MEQPNLEYINQLARGDESIKNELIDVIKTEFPEEKKDYYNSLESKEYKRIEENVHKLKHKISILGLEKSYEIANEFEHNLRELSLDRKEDFDEILIAISDYIEII
ncbi:Hpt domain-containing protein [Polaribacter sp. IC073]|uniref:Hpt domain-containing protein n=1 Tax=Polaribacter sp. IC073 TaxID=2508540 RepID=UPI0011BFC253|nr:Hpt domain-containing protein [Polaribacter sp. IC073]TXD49169.1 Hpt domain-containing protein [Polaribacter sp. IC073]